MIISSQVSLVAISVELLNIATDQWSRSLATTGSMSCISSCINTAYGLEKKLNMLGMSTCFAMHVLDIICTVQYTNLEDEGSCYID